MNYYCSAVLDEVSAFDEKTMDGELEKSKMKDNRKTKMVKGILVFEEFLHKLEASFKIESTTKNDRITLEF